MSSVSVSDRSGKRTRFFRQAESAAGHILEAFRAGNVPKALAPIFVRRKDDVPCRSWSWSNQLLTALAGHSDARGYRQWQEVGRHVKKGQKAFHILVPIVGKTVGKNPETGEEEERTFIRGFSSAPVFGFDQTEGEPLPPPDPEVSASLESLPVREVAESWGLAVDAYNGQAGRALGKYRHSRGPRLHRYGPRVSAERTITMKPLTLRELNRALARYFFGRPKPRPSKAQQALDAQKDRLRQRAFGKRKEEN